MHLMSCSGVSLARLLSLHSGMTETAIESGGRSTNVVEVPRFGSFSRRPCTLPCRLKGQVPEQAPSAKARPDARAPWQEPAATGLRKRDGPGGFLNSLTVTQSWPLIAASPASPDCIAETPGVGLRCASTSGLEPVFPNSACDS